jgi:hypothetical protein
VSNNSDTSRQQANNDFNRGNAPANTSNWDAINRAAYDAEYARRQQEQQEKNRG